MFRVRFAAREGRRRNRVGHDKDIWHARGVLLTRQAANETQHQVPLGQGEPLRGPVDSK